MPSDVLAFSMPFPFPCRELEAVFDVEEKPTFVFAAAARRLKPSPRMQWKRSAARAPQCYRNWQGGPPR